MNLIGSGFIIIVNYASSNGSGLPSGNELLLLDDGSNFLLLDDGSEFLTFSP